MERLSWSGLPGQSPDCAPQDHKAYFASIAGRDIRRVELLYPEAEAVLARVRRKGIRMILGHKAKHTHLHAWAISCAKLPMAPVCPKHFTMDAYRHGGMTELEEASLTDGQGRALSAHKSKAYDGYAKSTEQRMLAATKKRRAHVQTGQVIAK